MKIKSRHQLFNISRSRKIFNSKTHPNAKAWAIKAIAEESKKPSHQMWKKEPSAEIISEDQLKRTRFLRKHGNVDPELNTIADCLEQCEPINRCCSGACPECSRLFQRFYDGTTAVIEKNFHGSNYFTRSYVHTAILESRSTATLVAAVLSSNCR